MLVTVRHLETASVDDALNLLHVLGDGEWDAGAISDQMMLAARLASVDRASSRLGAPLGARIWEPSTAAREKSSTFALWGSARRT